MIGLQSIVPGGLVLAFMVSAGIGLYYREMAQRYETQLIDCKAKEMAMQDDMRKANEAVKSYEELIGKLRDECRSKVELLKKRWESELRSCERLLERRQRLEEKLDDIDRL